MKRYDSVSMCLVNVKHTIHAILVYAHVLLIFTELCTIISAQFSIVSSRCQYYTLTNMCMCMTLCNSHVIAGISLIITIKRHS